SLPAFRATAVGASMRRDTPFQIHGSFLSLQAWSGSAPSLHQGYLSRRSIPYRRCLRSPGCSCCCAAGCCCRDCPWRWGQSAPPVARSGNDSSPAAPAALASWNLLRLETDGTLKQNRRARRTHRCGAGSQQQPESLQLQSAAGAKNRREKLAPDEKKSKRCQEEIGCKRDPKTREGKAGAAAHGSSALLEESLTKLTGFAMVRVGLERRLHTR